MAIDATLDTFRALVSAHEALDRDEARLVISILLEECTQGHLIDNKRDVLTIALTLLEQKTQDDNDFTTLLLRLVCALKQRTWWPSNVSYEVAEVFVKLLTRLSVRGSSVELVLQFVRETVQETPTLEPEIQLAFAKFMTMTHCRVSIWRWQRLKVWELGADLPNACGILRAGSTREKLLILKCLLASSQATQESFMVSNDGAELTLIVCTRDSSSAVKELALEFVKDVVIHIPACRAHIINLWMTDATKFEHLDSDIFLEALVLNEISESLASPSSEGKLGNDHMFEAHALDWGQELVIDEGNGSTPQPFGDYPLPAIMNIGDKLEEPRNLKGGRSVTPSSIGSLLLKAVHTGSESKVLMELDLLVRWDEGLVVYLCTSLDLLEVFATRLSRSDTSFQVKSRLWNILLGLLNRNLQATPHLVVGIRAVAMMALDALATSGNVEAELFQMSALQGLRSPLLSSEENRKTVVELGAIPILVKLLAEQETETPWGRELIVTLREFAVGPHLGRAHEIDQVVASLCDQQDSNLRENPEVVVHYYQNLILLYHDIPGVLLGRLEGIDKVISAAAIMELLRNVCDLEKVLVMNYFHNELELHVSDPLYGVGARPELSAVVDVLCEKLEDVILAAIKAPAEVKKVARRILTAVAASNKASHEKLRVYQRLYRPEPALVLRGLLIEDCDEDMRQPEDGEEQHEQEDEYQYSDCDEEERGIGHMSTGEECEIDQKDCAQRDSDLGAYQVDGNGSIREKLAAVSLVDDWEMFRKEHHRCRINGESRLSDDAPSASARAARPQLPHHRDLPGAGRRAAAAAVHGAGWRFSSAPTQVYRQIFKRESGLKPLCAVIYQDPVTLALYQGSFAEVQDDKRAAGPSAAFGKFNVFVQCSDTTHKVCPKTTRVILESYGKVGVRRLKPHKGDIFARLPPTAEKQSVESLLTANMERFVKGRVFIETHSTELVFGDYSVVEYSKDHLAVDASEVIICHKALEGGFYFGEDTKLLIGSYASPQMMNELGYSVFLMAQTPDLLVGVGSSVLYTKKFGDDGQGDDAPQRMEHANGRFEICEHSGPSVGAALRRNNIHYAALHSVFVRCMTDQMAPSSSVDSIRKVYAVAVDNQSGTEHRNVVWTGKALECFARFPSFRSKFDLYVQCESVHQVLQRGARLMVDLQVIHEPPGPGREFPVALLRLYPTRLETNNAAIKDLGYEDTQENITGGFRRGWYHDGRYWRVVGDHPGAWVSGGTLGKPFGYNIRAEDDLGHESTRILVDIPGYGVCYCRGVRDDRHNPLMACVLFGPPQSGLGIAQNLAFLKYLGRWEDVFQ